MKFRTYVRKPFEVEAMEITAENIAEIADQVGTLRHKSEDGTPFIQVDRKKVPNIYRVFPGFFLTKMGDHIRCYSPRVFHEQFTLSTPDIKTWVEFMHKDDAERAVFRVVTHG